MNKELKLKWVKALFSNTYNQGRGFLQQDGKFCCLGVLCDIIQKEDPRLKRTLTGYSFNKKLSFNEYISPTLCKSIELDKRDVGDLIAMNDSHGNSFLEIAQHIEENL